MQYLQITVVSVFFVFLNSELASQLKCWTGNTDYLDCSHSLVAQRIKKKTNVGNTF